MFVNRENKRNYFCSLDDYIDFKLLHYFIMYNYCFLVKIKRILCILNS